MKKWIALVSILCATQAFGTPLTESDTLQRALAWMRQNPVMKEASRSVAAVETFPQLGRPFVYVVHLSPTGYLVLTPDDRFPLVTGFSPDASVDLSPDPENAFRSMLLRHVEQMKDPFVQPRSLGRGGTIALAEDTELYGPFLNTTWNQCNPYNKFSQSASGGPNSCADLAPTGCVPTAYAQLLKFHAWPYRGRGAHSYTDDQGAHTGTYYADFSNPYDWANMLPAYAVFDDNPEPAEAAVAELMQELGIAVEANYEAEGTTSSGWRLGMRLAEYFYYEPIQYHDTLPDLIAPVQEDLRAGFPCIVSIPGHVVVADGLMVDMGVTRYHINYGWGGQNNGWWSVNNVAGDPLKTGVTSLRPRLMAFPQSTAINSSTDFAELKWILPKQREHEVTQLNINHLAQQQDNWTSDGSDITAAISAGWTVVSDGYSGPCWFAGPKGPAFLILDEVFVPDASTQLTFWLFWRLGTATFTVEVSTDDGLSYTEICSENDLYGLAWDHKRIPLGAFEGQPVTLRFGLSFGSYYEGGGVWVDELAMTSGDWYDWEFFAADTELVSERFSEVTTELEACDDLSQFDVDSSVGDSKAWRVRHVEDVGNCFYIIPDGRGGTKDTITSKDSITPTEATRLILRTKYKLGSDQFRLLASTDGRSFSEIWGGAGNVDWTDVTIDLSAYAGQAIHIRLEYVPGGYFTDGIWVDSISTQEVTNPDLEGQPIHFTTLTDLPVGTHTMAATVVDANDIEHGISPSFTLIVSEPGDEG